MNRNVFLSGTVAALCLPLVTVAPAHAQSGLQVLEQSWDPVSRAIKSIPSFKDVVFFREAALKLWSESRPGIETQLKQALGQPGRMKGQTAYDIDLRLGSTPVASVSTDGSNQITLWLAIRGNSATFKTTQPTPAGKWADPKFGVSFDIEVEVVLEIPSDLTPITIARDTSGKELARVRIVNGKVSSQNLPADVAKAVVDVASAISQLVGGPDFWAELEKLVNRNRSIAPQVQAALSPVNASLASLKARGYTLLATARSFLAAESIRPTSVATLAPVALQTESGSCVTLLAYRTDYDVPTAGSGLLRGTIRWDKALGVPTVVRRHGLHRLQSSPFVFHAQLQNGPGQEGRFGTSTKQVTRPVHGELVETESGYEFHYEVLDLPNELPMELVTLGLAGNVSWAALNPQPLPPKVAAFNPDGWQGSIRILKQLPINRLKDIELRTRRFGQAPAEALLLLPTRFSCAAPQRPRRQTEIRLDRRPLSTTTQTFLRTNPEGRGVLEGIDFRLTVVAPTVIR